MDIQLNKQNHTLKAVITGRLSGKDASAWYTMIIDQLGDDVTEIVLNLAGVTYLTSTSLRNIIMLQKEMNIRDGELILEDPQEMVMDILQLSGMTAFLDIRKTG